MKNTIRTIREMITVLLLSFSFFIVSTYPLYAQDDARAARLIQNKIDNEKCFKCHGQRKFFYYNPVIEKEIKDQMSFDRVINKEAFYMANHKSFRCIDCHSEEYDSFPHSGALRMEPKYTCMDCHGGDEAYAKFNFEKIEEEFLGSVHSTKHSDDFTCWMCHNAHDYKISARNETDIKEFISYDNSICLSCHANTDKYQLLTNLTNPNLLQKHDWLPNQALHFTNVRCIECHAVTEKDILVGHKIKPKKDAVKNCVECHSQNSILLESLYRYQVKTSRNRFGFVNSGMLSDTYLIGANRNQYLNIASIILFILVLGVIAIHAILRIRAAKS